MALFDSQDADTIQTTALAGSPDAIFQLGLMYCAGRDVDQDLIEAHKWFNIAALKGNTEARQYRQEISREMTRQQIGAAQRRAREWLSRH